MSSNSHILVIDNNKDTLMELEFDLIEAGYTVLAASSGEQALALMSKQTVDLVLVEMNIPNISGMRVLAEVLKKRVMSIPVLMMSSFENEADIIEALDAGAEDYISKPYLKQVLLVRIRNALRLKDKTHTLESLLRTDSLTHINNRVGYEEQANKVLSHAKRNAHFSAVAMLYIDHFK